MLTDVNKRNMMKRVQILWRLAYDQYHFGLALIIYELYKHLAQLYIWQSR
jgi:hypothetical protein